MIYYCPIVILILDTVIVKRSLTLARLIFDLLLSNSYLDFRYSHSQAIANFSEINI
ncbi:hypothetical protein [Okeania sp. SIO2B3]|uniref:hypothetical protein n=1 Tax=Okeania sp. SIO2B3 TaxID=2607784 RepID=UPI0013BF849F|nr:hypothetical protein [Okeania sp. SIO2B3]NET42596.1 hypothetical protein [Okeania sp. SIO2B3]